MKEKRTFKTLFLTTFKNIWVEPYKRKNQAIDWDCCQTLPNIIQNP